MPISSKRGTRTSAPKADLRSEDPLDRLIHEGGLRIVEVEPLAHQGLLVVMLNTGEPMMVHTEHFPRLAKADQAQLDGWEIIAAGTAIGWEGLNEHLSLKGFLTTAVRNEVIDRLRSRLAQIGPEHRTKLKASPKAGQRMKKKASTNK